MFVELYTHTHTHMNNTTSKRHAEIEIFHFNWKNETLTETKLTTLITTDEKDRLNFLSLEFGKLLHIYP